MKILLVDDCTILLDGIANLLSKSANELVEKTNTINEALSYFEKTSFDIVITNYNRIDNSGLQLIRKIKKIYPSLKIIVLSMKDEAHLVEEVMKTKTDSTSNNRTPHSLADALNSQLNGKFQLNEEISEILKNSSHTGKLKVKITSVEEEILRLIAEEHTDQQMAEILLIGEKAVRNHRKSIFRKTKTSSESGLLKYAYANNLL